MTTLADRYVLEARLGSGGTATVWRATDQRLGVVRAVKVLDVAPGPEREALRSRLRAEARAMARVEHPNVVAVHDVGEDGDSDFIVMDLVDGPSLEAWLESHGRMPTKEAVRLVVDVLGALEAAHGQGIVHRDVKPGNVLLDREGVAHLCDFGIALADVDQRHTRTGVALGSLPYMAPEQRRDARSVGPAADLYGAGCTLYRALTGATPVDLYLAPGKSPRWSAVPEHLVSVIRRATQAEASDRYESADAMRRALVRAAPAPEPVPPELVEHATEESTTSKPLSAARVLTLNLVITVVVVLASFIMVLDIQQRAIDGMAGRQPAPGAGGADDGEPLAEWRVRGRWSGPWDGESPGVELTLRGENAELEGDILIHLGGGSTRTSPVRGSFDPETRLLLLNDREAQPGSGSYRLRLEGSGALAGQFEPNSGAAAIPFLMVRVSE